MSQLSVCKRFIVAALLPCVLLGCKHDDKHEEKKQMPDVKAQGRPYVSTLASQNVDRLIEEKNLPARHKAALWQLAAAIQDVLDSADNPKALATAKEDLEAATDHITKLFGAPQGKFTDEVYNAVLRRRADQELFDALMSDPTPSTANEKKSH